jgi:lipopolysaccharide export system permease protein
MKILDRYVSRTFSLVLIGSIVAFISVFVILNLTEHLEDFIDQDAPLIAPVLYYIYFMPYMAILTLPVAMLLASLSTMGGLVRSNELLAMKASGISSFRPIRTVIILSLFVSVAAFVIGETVVPRTNEAKEMIWNRYIKKSGAVSRTSIINRALDLGEGRVLFVQRYNTEEQQALDVTLAETSGIQVTRLLQATRMNFLPEEQLWLFDSATERTWTDGRETFAEHTSLRQDLPHLSPDEMAERRKDPEEMGYAELYNYVSRGLARGRDVTRALVDLNMKVSLPFANFIIVLFGTALAAVRRRTGLAVGFTASIFICFIYYGFMEAGRAFGYNGNLPPVIAAWIGNLTFGIFGLYFLRRARF